MNKLNNHEKKLQKYQLIIFDWEGTIGDSRKGGLIDGADNLIKKLFDAGYFLAIATNKGQLGLKHVLEQTQLGAFFCETRAAGQVPPKPCPQMLVEILESVGVTVDDAIMIGDSIADIEMAQSIGMDALGVDFYQSEGHALLNAGALEVCNEYSQIESFLEKNA